MTTRDALLQLVGVGVLWMTVHCAGMCGPLLSGLDVSGAARGYGAFRGIRRMLAYQSGRALTYATLGALAGLLGDGLAHVSSRAGAALAVVMGLVALAKAAGVLDGAFSPTRAPGLVDIGGRTTTKRSRLAQLSGRALALTSGQPFLLGAMLGFLPCMIALWALGLAALTGSPAGGALVMLALVAMTTPVIVLIGVASRALAFIPRAVRAKAPRVMLAISGTWLVLVGLAGAKVIGHMHVEFGPFTMMLY